MGDINKLENYQVYTDTQALNDLKLKAKTDSQAALRPVAEQFEAIFIEQVLKESRKVKLDEGWLDGDKADFYQDWHDKQFSQSISAKGGLGLVDTIIEQLTPKYPIINQLSTEDNTQNYKNNEQITAFSTTKKQLELRNLANN